MKHHDPNSEASHPGGFSLSDRKLELFHPELYSDQAWRMALERYPTYPQHTDRTEWREHLAEHLRFGDSRAALLVSTEPMIIAAYTDDLDCVVFLQFDRKHMDPSWHVGSRLLTVNTYSFIARGLAADLTLGPGHTGRWGNYWPLIADLLTEESSSVEQRKAAISADEWRRVSDLAA